MTFYDVLWCFKYRAAFRAEKHQASPPLSSLASSVLFSLARMVLAVMPQPIKEPSASSYRHFIERPKVMSMKEPASRASFRRRLAGEDCGIKTAWIWFAHTAFPNPTDTKRNGVVMLNPPGKNRGG